MSGRIPQAFIDELMARTDIVELIDSRVPLKKAGREYTACCPFHTEKTPSFTVSPQKQFYHCFGCGAHGTVIGFLMEYERMSFMEVLEELAQKNGMELPKDNKPYQHKQYTDQYALLEKVAQYYEKMLLNYRNHEQIQGFLRQRGIQEETVKSFSLGYAPSGWANLQRQFSKQQESLIRLGLLIRKDKDNVYDRFRDRIMFPIHDNRGRIIGFGGRTLVDDAAKYLNSPESALFHKGRELYNLHRARLELKNFEHILVVEGYMDALMLAQAGLGNVVATLGTATTQTHIQRLFSLSQDIVFCFDGDRAGKKAAWRALETVLPFMEKGRQVRFMFLPDGEDPDSMIQKVGKSVFLERIQNAPQLSTFLYEELQARVDINTVDGRARLVELARPLLEKLPDGVYKQLMSKQLSELAQADVGQFIESGETVVKETVQAQKQVRNNNHRQPSLIRIAIALLLQQPNLANEVELGDELRELDIPGMNLLLRLIEMVQGQPHISNSALLERWRDTEEGKHLYKLSTWDPMVPEGGERDEFLGAIARLHQQSREQRLERLLAKTDLSPKEKRELSELLVETGA